MSLLIILHITIYKETTFYNIFKFYFSALDTNFINIKYFIDDIYQNILN